MEWDDLRFFLAVAKAGSLAGAARALGVNHSTVFRRLNAFERKLGVRAFERLPGGYVLTAAGEEMRASATRVEAEIDRLNRHVNGQDLRLTGPLAITSTDTLMAYVLGPHLRGFHDAYPGIGIDVSVSNENVSLSRRLADVAVRPTTSPPEALVGRQLCAIAFAPYASPAYLQGVPDPADLAALAWLVPDDTLAHLPARRWMQAALPDATVALRANNLLTMLAAARSGMGAAVLPCFMGDRELGLQRIVAPIADASSLLWLLTHEDLRHTARVRAFMSYMATALSEEIELLEGRAPVSSQTRKSPKRRPPSSRR